MLRWLMFCILSGCTIFGSVYLITRPFWPDRQDSVRKEGGISKTVTKPDEGSGPGSDESYLHPGVILRDCRLASINKEEVPSQRDGTLVLAGVEIPPGPNGSAPGNVDISVDWVDIAVPSGPSGNQTWRLLKPGEDFDVDKQTVQLLPYKRYFKKLRQGVQVVKDQIVAVIDPKLAIADLAVKHSKMLAAAAERDSSTKLLAEADQRLRSAQLLRSKNSISDEDFRSAQLAVDRYSFETKAKAQGVNQGKTELLAARTVLMMHEVRTAQDGTVRLINKQPGEALKSGETILDIQDLEKLRVEGFVEVQNASALEVGMTVDVEPTRPVSPSLVLSGHLLELNSVAATRLPIVDGAIAERALLISSSDDKTVRLWEIFRDTAGIWNGKQIDLRRVPEPIRCLAFAPVSKTTGNAEFMVVGGSSAGKLFIARLILDPKGSIKITESKEIPAHRSTIQALAFSPDGKILATVGQDTDVIMWSVPSKGIDIKEGGRINSAHKAEITQVAFAEYRKQEGASPLLRMITSSNDKDRTLTSWNISTAGGLNAVKQFDVVRRGGEITHPGISPDGRHVLVDQGKEIKILSLIDRQPKGLIQNVSSALNFTTMALFSPDGEMVLTNCAEENRVQLWRSPLDGSRAAELRQFVWAGDGTATCGAFDPGRKFVVTGTTDHQVLVWNLPEKTEVDTILTGTIELVSKFIDSNNPQRLFRAELDLKKNPGYLMPGGTATIVYPSHKDIKNAPKPQ